MLFKGGFRVRSFINAINNSKDLLIIVTIFLIMTGAIIFRESEEIESILYRTFFESSIDFEGSISIQNFKIEFNGGKEKGKARITFLNGDTIDNTSFVLLDYYREGGKSYYLTPMQSWRNIENLISSELLKRIEEIKFEKSKIFEDADIKEEGIEYISLKQRSLKEMEIRTRVYSIKKKDFFIKVFVDDSNQIKKLEVNLFFCEETITAEIFLTTKEMTRAGTRPEAIDIP